MGLGPMRNKFKKMEKVEDVLGCGKILIQLSSKSIVFPFLKKRYEKRRG